MDAELKLKILFLIIIIIEIPLGLLMIIVPNLVIDLLSFPKPQDPIIFGVAASLWLAFGVISFLGYREPMKYFPIILFQFTYKCIWFLGVIIPQALAGSIQTYGITMIIVFAFFIVADIIVIPWNKILEKK
ncbi:MAG: hypothetical protein ACTSQP_14060 [Promethearchaeota archaeon]